MFYDCFFGFETSVLEEQYMGIGQNPIPLVNINIAGKWMFIPLKMVLIGIDPSPHSVSLDDLGVPTFVETSI